MTTGAGGSCSYRARSSSSSLVGAWRSSSTLPPAMAAGRSAWNRLSPLLRFSHRQFLYNRGLLFAFSTAAQQRSTGDDCGPEDPHEEPRHPNENSLEDKAIKLEEQIRVLTEQYQRALTDSENVRRRTQKFVEDAKLFGIQSFCRDLVEVADILEKTTESAGGEDDVSTLKKVCEGLSLIESKLQRIFAKHGLQKMNPIGGKYDPYAHEIVCHVPAEDLQPGTVAIVTLDGYKLHGRTIRHAHVGVAVESQECDGPAH